MPKRPLDVIAQEIQEVWPNVYYAAEPYLQAMRHVTSPNDIYMCVNGKAIVLYFLCNAAYWRGADARRIKAELNTIIKQDNLNP